MTHLKALTSAIHLHTAAIDRAVILVFQDGELIGTGRVDEITDETVKIRGEWYIRAACTFCYAK